MDGRASAAAVLERVRQRLLHDPERGQLDPDRQLSPLAVDLNVDGQAGLANLRDERRQDRQGSAAA